MFNIDNPLSEYQPPSKEALRNFGIDISREEVEKYALEKFDRLPQSRIELNSASDSNIQIVLAQIENGRIIRDDN